MGRIQFLAYEGEDILAMTPGGPLPAPLGELTDAFEKHVYAELYGTGMGEFTIDRDSSQASWAAYGNWVGAKRTWETDPFLLFHIEERDDVFVSKDEQLGEYLHRGGRGQLVVLEWARLLHYWSLGGTSLINAIEGWWEFGVAATPGQVMKTAIDDAQARTPAAIPFVSYSFGNVNDSDAVAWDVPDGEPQAPIGATLLELLDSQVEREVEAQMSPLFELGMYSLYQRDKTTAVVFRKGFNISDSAHIDGQYGIGSRTVVRGSNDAGEHTYAEVTDASTATLEGGRVGRRELFLEHGAFKSTTDLNAAGRQQLKSSRAKTDGELTVGVTHGTSGTDGESPAAQHLEPFLDYRVGDLITLDIPGAHDNTQHRISGIHIHETDGGEDEEPDLDDPDGLRGGYEVTVELDGQPYRSSGFDVGDRPGDGGTTPSEPVDAPLATLDIGDADRYGMSILDGEFGFADWEPTINFESTPTVGLGAGIAHEFNESFAVCWPSNNAFRGSGKGYGQLTWSLVGDSDPGDALLARVTIAWSKSANSLRICQTPEGTTGMGDGATVLNTPGLFEVRVLEPGVAKAQGDVFAGAAVGLIGGSDSGSVELLVPIRYVTFGDGLGLRLLIAPLFEADWAGWTCKSGFSRAGIESFIAIDDSSAVIVHPTGAGWVTGGVLGTQDGSNDTFTLVGTVEEVSDVYVNGLQQPPSAWEFDETAQELTTLGWAPIDADTIEVKYRIS